MNLPLKQERTLDAVERQAHDWARRLAAGGMRRADAEALKQWCARSPQHAAAFALAHRRWEQVGAAARAAAAGDAAMSRGWKTAAAPAAARWQRRGFIGAAVSAAAAAVAGVAVVRPPLGLWPSVEEMRADYRTATGEQRSLALGDDVALEMNTRTSIALRRPEGEAAAFELVSGEAAIDMLRASRPLVVHAGAGQALAQAARFEVRHLGGTVCVTCLEGAVRVEHPGGSAMLKERQRLDYDALALGTVVDVAPANLPAWREGYLRFSDTALSAVVDEVNRYRPGRVVLLANRMASRSVTGRFRIAQLDNAIAQMQRSLQLELTTLPGGVLLLS